MKPGEFLLDEEEIVLNEGREVVEVVVKKCGSATHTGRFALSLF